MNSFDVSELKENTFFTADVVLDKTFLLLNNSIPVTKSLIDALNDWEFNKIYSDGNIRTTTANFDSVVTNDDEFIVEKTTSGATQKITETKSISVNEFQTTQRNMSVPTPTPPKPNIAAITEIQTNTADSTENSRLNVVQNVYNEYLNYISNIYTHYANK